MPEGRTKAETIDGAEHGPTMTCVMGDASAIYTNQIHQHELRPLVGCPFGRRRRSGGLSLLRLDRFRSQTKSPRPVLWIANWPTAISVWADPVTDFSCASMTQLALG